MTVLEKPGVAAAEANWGRWWAVCSWRDRCDATIPVDRFAAGIVCPECWMSTELVWPSADMVAGIERLLLMRPHPKTQNWCPPQTLHDLLQENLDHGVMSRFAVGVESGLALSIDGDQITRDALPNLNPRRELVR